MMALSKSKISAPTLVNDNVHAKFYFKNLSSSTISSLNSESTLVFSDERSEIDYGLPYKTLGKGSGGTVRLHIKNNQNLAIKEYAAKKPRESEQKYLAKIKEEYNISKDLNHPNIAASMDLFQKDGKQFMVMPYAPKDLFSVLTDCNNELMDVKQCEQYFKQIVLGLKYLQSNNIVHRDIKPENLVVDGDNLKIIDFGCAKKEPAFNISGLVGSQPYIAPEVYSGSYNPYKIDLWSAMIVFLVVSNNRFPWRKATIDDKKFHKFLFDNEEREKLRANCRSSKIRSFILQVLDPNPDNRLTIDELLELDSFRQL